VGRDIDIYMETDGKWHQIKNGSREKRITVERSENIVDAF